MVRRDEADRVESPNNHVSVSAAATSTLHSVDNVDSHVAKSTDSRESETEVSHLADDAESCVTVSDITSAVNKQLPCHDSSFSNCYCGTSSCTS